MLLIHVESCLGGLGKEYSGVSPLSSRQANRNHTEAREPLGPIFHAIDTYELFIFLKELFSCVKLEAKALRVICCDQAALIVKEADRR